jgi:hypothetical protein
MIVVPQKHPGLDWNLELRRFGNRAGARLAQSMSATLPPTTACDDLPGSPPNDLNRPAT